MTKQLAWEQFWESVCSLVFGGDPEASEIVSIRVRGLGRLQVKLRRTADGVCIMPFERGNPSGITVNTSFEKAILYLAAGSHLRGSRLNRGLAVSHDDGVQKKALFVISLCRRRQGNIGPVVATIRHGSDVRSITLVSVGRKTNSPGLERTLCYLDDKGNLGEMLLKELVLGLR